MDVEAEATMAAAQGWSSLPSDLVNRVADCLLDTNDLDCYTDLRAVCHHWRSVTADPGSNQHDPRFRPSRWVMLDEHKASSAAAAAAITVDDSALLFVNTATGRFLRRSFPLFGARDCFVFVTSTTDGLLVLAGRDPPHAVSVLNPLTGSLLRFAAALPSEPRRLPRLRLTAEVVGSSPPALVLVSVGRSWLYWAEPQSESFSVEKSHRDCPASRLSQIIAAGGKCPAAVNHKSVPAGAKNIFDQLRSEEDESCRCYAVVADGGDMLAVLKRRGGMDVFKIDAAGNVMERVKSIGSLALFLGVRCLVVDTDCFPMVEPNCAYFQLTDLDDDRYIYKFSIGTCGNEEEPELVSADMDNTRTVVPCNNLGPFTITQLLCNYTMDIPGHQLTWEVCSSYLELEGYTGDGHYAKYINYVDYESDEDWESDYQYRRDDDCYYHLFDRDR